ncbi:hypothetical protein DVH05_024187 [Phytophthora capsici]|nr:hypothetical protein DVH05_024187 [Phytophthora capsici]
MGLFRRTGQGRWNGSVLKLAATCDQNLTDEYRVGSWVPLALKNEMANVEVAIQVFSDFIPSWNGKLENSVDPSLKIYFDQESTGACPQCRLTDVEDVVGCGFGRGFFARFVHELKNMVSS